MKKLFSYFLVALVCVLSGCSKPGNGKKIVQIGHFPNITHAQALIAHQLSLEGRGWFEKYLGDNVEIQWRVFNAGPSAMESLFAGSVDVTYVGPNPAINAYVKSGTSDIRLLAGAVEGGAALVVQPNSTIKTPKDFKGKVIATPQLGNTQDVVCRAYLKRNGVNVTLSGGDAQIVPTSNPDQLVLFKTNRLDAVWTVEPWVSRLELNASAKVFLEQNDAITTVLATSVKMLEKEPELSAKIKQANKELTEWILANPKEAKALTLKALESLTKGKIPPELVDNAWKRIKFTHKINEKSLNDFMNDALSCGFIKGKVEIDKFILKNAQSKPVK